MGKNIFGISHTAEKIDGADFIVRSNPPEILNRMDEISAEAQTLVLQNSPSRRWSLLRTLLLTAGTLLFMFGIFNASSAGKLSFFGVFQASPVLMILAIVSLASSVAMVVIERNRMKKSERGEALAEWKMRSKEAEKEAYAALQVPQDAISLDLLTATYTQKNGAVQNVTYTAFDFYAWIENECLCLADVENVVAVPLEQIQGISEVAGKTGFYFWNKKESPQSETYRKYQIRRTFFGGYSVKGVRVAHIRGAFGEYELLIPPYELDTFLRLTGKAVRSEEKIEE